tara:strand:+ start:34418 stop:34585 length:168 start_codon:yes stop_codon:yes gene_type:complete
MSEIEDLLNTIKNIDFSAENHLGVQKVIETELAKWMICYSVPKKPFDNIRYQNPE